MRLTDHFTLSEFTISQTAARLGINNEPGPEVVEQLLRTAQLLEKVRSILKAPIQISSGYRSPELNANPAIGGAINSAHVWGGAADFTAPGFGSPLKIVHELMRYPDVLDWDQLIFEFDSWVHIGRAPPGSIPRRQVLTIDKHGTFEGIVDTVAG